MPTAKEISILIVDDHPSLSKVSRRCCIATPISAASTRTVETHRLRIREKLTLPSSYALSHFAISWVRESEQPDAFEKE